MTIIIQDEVYTPPLATGVDFTMVTASVGREAYIIDPVTGICVAGVQLTDLSASFSTIDITDNNSSGYRELLDIYGVANIDFSISGVIKDGSLRKIAQENTGDIDMTNYKFKWADGSELSTRYVMTNYTETFPTSEAATFSATILTSGKPSIS